VISLPAYRGQDPEKDLLAFDEFDLRPLPLVERKKLLSRLVPAVGPIRAVDHVEGKGRALYASVRELGLEGMVAKRAQSPYRGGRFRDWQKVRADRAGRADHQEDGWQRPSTRRQASGHEGADTYSHLMAFSGAGSIVGALIVAWLGKFPKMGWTALIVQAVYGLLIIAFAVSRVLWLSDILLFFTGAALMIVFSTVTSLVQMIAPNNDRRLDFASFNQLVHGDTKFSALAVAEPANPRGQSLEMDSLFRQFHPARER